MCVWCKHFETTILFRQLKCKKAAPNFGWKSAAAESLQGQLNGKKKVCQQDSHAKRQNIKSNKGQIVRQELKQIQETNANQEWPGATLPKLPGISGSLPPAGCTRQKYLQRKG